MQSAAVEPPHAGDGGRMGRVQMHDGAGAAALFVHRPVQERFLRGRIAGDQRPVPVELGDPRRVEAAEAGVGRGQQPAVVEPHADVAAAAGGQTAFEDRSAERDDLIARRVSAGARNGALTAGSSQP